MPDTAHTSQASGSGPRILTEDVRDSRAWRRADLSPPDWVVTLPPRCVEHFKRRTKDTRCLLAGYGVRESAPSEFSDEEAAERAGELVLGTFKTSMWPLLRLTHPLPYRRKAPR